MTLFDLQPLVKKEGIQESVNVTTKISASIVQARKKIIENGWPSNFFVVTTADQMQKIKCEVKLHKDMFFDLETSGLNAWKDRVYSCGISVGSNNYIIPFEHQFQPCATRKDFVDILGPLFNDTDVNLINHTVKFDCHMLEESMGIKIGRIHCDIYLLEMILNADKFQPHGLKEIAFQRYGVAEKSGNYKQQFGMSAWSYIDPLVANWYGCHDTELAKLVYEKQLELLETKPKLKRLFWDYEVPVMNIAYSIERRGLRVDEEYFHNNLKPWVYQEYAKAVEPLRPFIEPYLTDFDSITKVLESPKKLGDIFFDILKIPLTENVTLKKNKKGEWVPTLSVDAIVQLRDEYPCMKYLGEYRKIATLKKLFIDQLEDMIVNGRIHPSVNSTGTATGRMSCSSPNLQQMPARDGPRVRNMFLPDEGNVLVSMDYSQQELRIMAHLSGDEKLKRIFAEDKDLYSETSYELWGTEPGPLNTDEEKKASWHRRTAKMLILGKIFEMKYKKFAKGARIKPKEAKVISEAFDQTYPGIIAYQERAHEFARKNKYIVTLMGRERPLPNINSSDSMVQFASERAASNSPIQGSAADMLKAAIVKISKHILKNDWPVKIWLSVHDEIIYEVNEVWFKTHPEHMNTIRVMQENALKLSVPMKCSMQVERRWGTEVKFEDEDLEFLEEVS